MKSEFDFIENLKEKYPIRYAHTAIRVGIGDDCAVVSKNAKTDLVITTDLLVEEIDFRLEWTKPEFLGHKALAVSLSDVAAMGAKPVWAMLSVGVPKKIWKTDFVEKFYDGWFALASKYAVELVGGDVSETPDKIVIDSIVAGETKKGKAVLRSTAKPDDLIFVTGKLGGAAIGLELLEKGKRFENSKKRTFLQKLLLRQLCPNPQTEAGQILGENDLASAMIDLSDGLSSDLAHLCRASNVGAKIFADKIPFDDAAKIERQSEIEDRRPKTEDRRDLFFALDGGEDFELLFTVNPKKISLLEKKLKNFSFSRIGETTSNSERIELISANKTTILQPEGFRHF